MRRWATVGLVVAAAALLSCKLQLTPEGLARTWHAIADARKDLTPENEYYVGRSVATNLLAKHQYHYRDADALSQGRLEGLTAYVNAVGAVVATAAMDTPRSGDRPMPIGGWHFVIVEDRTINAFAAPGGWVFVTSAAVQAATSEDELAAILAHEVAHVVRGHALGSIKKSRWAGVAKEALDSSVQLDQQALGNLTQVFEGALDDMIDATLVKGYSRDTEFEADKVGFEIMAKAGYDPSALVSYLEKLAKNQSTGSGGFYATHPKATDRIGKLKGKLAKAERVTVPKVRIQRFQVATAELRQSASR